MILKNIYITIYKRAYLSCISADRVLWILNIQLVVEACLTILCIKWLYLCISI